MKKLLFIFVILLTSCTRYIVVIVQPTPKEVPPGTSMLLGAEIPGYFDDLVLRYIPMKADTASFMYRLHRGDFCDSSGVLDVPQGGLGLHIRTRDTTDIGDRGDITVDCINCKTWAVDVDQIIKQSKYKTDSTLFSKP